MGEMKKIICSLAAVAALLSGCMHQSYSVSTDAVEEMLAAPALAVTPFLPAWLNEGGEDIWKLSEADRTRVCAILRSGKNRPIDELVYQMDDGSAPLAQNRFYLYASNAQCLAGTVLDKHVIMHDIMLEEVQEQELYTILKPYLRKLFRGLE